MKERLFNYMATLVDYDEVSGVFTWRLRENNTRANKIFNKQFGGKVLSTTDTHGYITTKISFEGSKKLVKLHQLAWFLIHKTTPKGVIDHIDGNPTNNRISNLRDVSRSCNQRNTKIRSDNTSGVSGVSQDKRDGRWYVKFADEVGKQRSFGGADTFEEAVEIARKARRGLGYTDRHYC